MILTINTIDRNSIEIGIYQKDELHCFEFETKLQSEDLLPAIEGILKKEKINLQEIKSVLVDQGPGSYTGVRVGVTVANTLGWTLNIPVFGYRQVNLPRKFLRNYKEGELEIALEKITKSKETKFSKIVLPYYK